MITDSIAFLSSEAPEAREAASLLATLYGQEAVEEAETIVALGGDGFMLQTLHMFMNSGKRIYGMNRGSVGFLMNDFREDGLRERIAAAVPETIRPLRMRAEDMNGEVTEAFAINEVSLFRQSYQAAKIAIHVDGKERLAELICDGVMLATPAGSTAYNLSAQGPIIPIDAPLLALTPVSPFRPRRWRGALLPNQVSVNFAVLVLNAVEAAGYTRTDADPGASHPACHGGQGRPGHRPDRNRQDRLLRAADDHPAERGRARARMPRTLILEPTRELAAQVEENFNKYGINHKLNVALLIGGVSFDEQDRKLQRGVDVLIATPGRLLDHFERGKLLLTGVEILVIDEADRMLDMGFIPDIERICKLMPFTRQTLFFSATMPPEITRLADQFLHAPVRVEVSRAASTATTVDAALSACRRRTSRSARPCAI
jgi:NAD+ kinase